MGLIVGFHPVREALRAGLPLERIVLVKGAGRAQEIVDLARKGRVPLRFETREALDRLAKGVPHQGVLALGAAEKHASLEDVLEAAELLVVLDGVEDPHNLGAIVRTAHAAGASGVVIPERRAAGLTETVAKAAAGALAWLPVVRVTNVNRALEKLKESGFWIYGLDERGEQSYTETDFALKSVIVLGAEGGGLHQQVREHCDFLLKIPMAGQVASLNVSVAAGVVLFEWRRRRGTR
jgi:23S rRNA (guanosine2251-2'-O)-methyltransferase